MFDDVWFVSVRVRFRYVFYRRYRVYYGIFVVGERWLYRGRNLWYCVVVWYWVFKEILCWFCCDVVDEFGGEKDVLGVNDVLFSRIDYVGWLSDGFYCGKNIYG